MKLIAAMSFTIALAAEAPTVTGTWNMGLQGDHVIPTALVLKQQDKTVTGTIALPTQNIGRMYADGEATSGDVALLIAFGAGLAYAAQVVVLP